jgi:hypothetical protein
MLLIVRRMSFPSGRPLQFLGDELIELNESMLSALCNECEQLRYCKKHQRKK